MGGFSKDVKRTYWKSTLMVTKTLSNDSFITAAVVFYGFGVMPLSITRAQQEEKLPSAV